MIKSEMADVKAVNFLIKHARPIPVDRRNGRDAFEVAVERLREGELVGVHPEATISRSYELKDFKTGAARMALEAQVPIIPLIVWGAQRIWTKDHPKKVVRNKIPITVAAGRPLPPRGTPEELNASLRAGDDRRCCTRCRRSIRTLRVSTGCRAGSAAARRRGRFAEDPLARVARAARQIRHRRRDTPGQNERAH